MRVITLLLACSWMLYAVTATGAVRSDINLDEDVTLEDVITGLQLLSGMTPSILPMADGVDVDGDGRIGFDEVLDALQTIAYGLTLVNEVVSADARIWMDRNLGASQAATGSDDPLAYGDLYQWGRGRDGHEKRDSATTTTLSSLDTPGHGDFILSTTAPFDWRTTLNNDLWQGVSGTNNPCPSGFRLPTVTEMETEYTNWGGSPNYLDAFASQLALPAAGYRYASANFIEMAGPNGSYWTATVGGDSVIHLYFNNSTVDVAGGAARASGRSVRCIKD